MIEFGGRDDPNSLIGYVAGGGSRYEVEFPGGSSPAIAIDGGPGDGRAPIQVFVRAGGVSGASPVVRCRASPGSGVLFVAGVFDPPSGRGVASGDSGSIVADCDEPSVSGDCSGDDDTG